MKYLTILFVTAALLCSAITATGGQLDVGTLVAVLAAACLPVFMAYEYRSELWPKRRKSEMVEPAVAPAKLAARRFHPSRVGAWNRPAAPVAALTYCEPSAK